MYNLLSYPWKLATAILEEGLNFLQERPEKDTKIQHLSLWVGNKRILRYNYCLFGLEIKGY